MDNWKQFIKAGNALFTIKNEKTGGHFTYKVRKHKQKDLWFVKVLAGPNNETDYQYIGTIFPDGFKITKASKCQNTANSFVVFNWLLHQGTLPEHIKFSHYGRCCRCGRTLTHPDSIATGIGPECAGRINSNGHDTVDARKLRAKARRLKDKIEKEVNHEPRNCRFGGGP